MYREAELPFGTVTAGECAIRDWGIPSVSIEKIARHAAVKAPGLRNAMRRARFRHRSRLFDAAGKGVAVDPHTVIFAAYNGESYSCTPKAVYEYMLGDARFGDWHFIWIFKDPEGHAGIPADGRTSIVGFDTEECMRELHAAKYWILNSRAVDWWQPSGEQIYVQCWHGTPLKRLGCDLVRSDNAMNTMEDIRFKYRSDAKRFSRLLSPCPFSTEHFRSAWDLDALGRTDALLETGYPRDDFLSRMTREDIEDIKRRLGLADEKRKIILYAPTWRDDQYDAGLGYTYDIGMDFGRMRDALGDRFLMLFRAHYLVADTFDFDEYGDFVRDVSRVDDINELYAVSDMLITDYSSVFFDYAILERPIFFYMYDRETYMNDLRGFYLAPEDLPGPVSEDVGTLTEQVLRASEGWEPDEKYRAFNRRFNSLNDGRATERFIDAVFDVRSPAGGRQD